MPSFLAAAGATGTFGAETLIIGGPPLFRSAELTEGEREGAGCGGCVARQ